MSIIAVMAVLDAATPLSQSEAFVLVVLASYADEHGGNCWPSLPTIARKARLTTRGVWEILRRLKRRGLLSVIERAAQHRSTRYRLELAALSREDRRPSLGDARLEPGSSLRASRSAARAEPRSTPDRNHATARPEPHSTDPSVLVSDPSGKPAAPVFSNAGQAPVEVPFKVHAAVATRALNDELQATKRGDPDKGAVADRYKWLCAQQGYQTDPATTTKAIDAAFAARNKKAAEFHALWQHRRGGAR